MKKIIFLMLVIAILSGCFLNPSLYPKDKTEDDWVKDELYCREISGKETGIKGLLIPWAFTNLAGPNQKYNACLREKGWLK
jgi:hypothetical protein